MRIFAENNCRIPFITRQARNVPLPWFRQAVAQRETKQHQLKMLDTPELVARGAASTLRTARRWKTASPQANPKGTRRIFLVDDEEMLAGLAGFNLAPKLLALRHTIPIILCHHPLYRPQQRHLPGKDT